MITGCGFSSETVHSELSTPWKEALNHLNVEYAS